MNIQITSQTRIFIGQEALDFRTGMNGTAAACRLKIQQNPLDGGVFVFINKSRTMIRLYLFDGHGEVLLIKRVAEGRFSWWNKDEVPAEVMVEHIHLLLRGGDPKKIIFPPPWKRPT